MILDETRSPSREVRRCRNIAVTLIDYPDSLYSAIVRSYNGVVTSRSVVLALASLCLSANAQPQTGDSKSVEQVRGIILRSQHLGAHGVGYNRQSQNLLSHKLTSADIPTLISLLADEQLHTGAQFALASQCEAAIIPVRESVGFRQIPGARDRS